MPKITDKADKTDKAVRVMSTEGEAEVETSHQNSEIQINKEIFPFPHEMSPRASLGRHDVPYSWDVSTSASPSVDKNCVN